jgi:hypothetical protein
VLHNTVDEAVVSIGALVVTLQALPALVAGDAEGKTVFCAELLELSHDAGGDDGDAFSVEAVHKRREQVQLGADGVGEEVGVNENRVRRDEGGVGLEEESGRDLGAAKRKSQMLASLGESSLKAIGRVVLHFTNWLVDVGAILL